MNEHKKLEEQSTSVLQQHNLTHRFIEYTGGRESSIYANDDQELIFMRRISIQNNQYNAHHAHHNNFHNVIHFYQLYFLDIDTRIEIETSNIHSVVLILNEHGVFENGSLDLNAVKNMTKKYGENSISSRFQSPQLLLINR